MFVSKKCSLQVSNVTCHNSKHWQDNLYMKKYKNFLPLQGLPETILGVPGCMLLYILRYGHVHSCVMCQVAIVGLLYFTVIEQI